MKNKKSLSKGHIAIISVAILLTVGVIGGGIYTVIQRQMAKRPRFIQVAKGENLDIPFADLTSEINFFPVMYDGTDMGVITVKDDLGNVRTAFDACQTCYDKGNGYYEYEDGVLVCQACGNTFELSDVGKKSKDECVPFPITDIARFDNMDMIIISGDALEAGRWLFQDWDKYGK